MSSQADSRRGVLIEGRIDPSGYQQPFGAIRDLSPG